jgi:hypothetical protein
VLEALPELSQALYSLHTGISDARRSDTTSPRDFDMHDTTRVQAGVVTLRVLAMQLPAKQRSEAISTANACWDGIGDFSTLLSCVLDAALGQQGSGPVTWAQVRAEFENRDTGEDARGTTWDELVAGQRLKDAEACVDKLEWEFARLIHDR